MKVTCPPFDTMPNKVKLGDVKSGRAVVYTDMEGAPGYYLATKLTPLERKHLDIPPGKHLLVNLETGRVVLKPSTLLVYLTSCSAEAYPTPN